MFKISEFSKISQVSVKTLRYYDQLDLLKPAPAFFIPALSSGYCQRGKQRSGLSRQGKATWEEL